jgi:hypothetical protein
MVIIESVPLEHESGVAPSLDYLIRPQQQRLQDGEAKGLGGLEVDDQVEPG